MARAQGGPPLQTDDPGTPGDRQWEVNTAFTLDRTPAGQTLEAPLVDANYGLGPRIQLKVEMPWVVESPAPEALPSRNGAGNALIGVKWRFLDEQEGAPALAFYPQVRLAASAHVGDDPGFLLPLSLQKSIGPISVNGEIGYFWNRDQPNQWIAGLALGHEFSKTFEGLAEIFTTADSRFGQNHVLFHAGARWDLGAHETLLLAIGRGFGNAPQDPTLDAYVGLQARF